MNLPMIPIIRSVTDLRYQTAEIIRLVNQGQPVVVTKDSDTVAIVFSPQQYQLIFDLMVEVEDKKDRVDLEQAIKKGGDFEEFKKVDKRIRKKLQLS